MQQLISCYFGSEQVEIIKLTGGVSNYVFKVAPILESKQSTVILRIFGPIKNTMIDRNFENLIITFLEKYNITPKFLVIKEYGRIETIVNGIELDYKMSCIPDTIYKLGFAINNLHKKLQSIKSNTKNFLIKSFKSFLKNTTLSEEIQKIVQQELIYLKKINYKAGVIHNDLTLGNIFIDLDQINFIDFEYAGYNFFSYDLANFINEREGLYFNNPPMSHDELINLISGYAYDKSTDEKNQILKEVYDLIPTSHLLWAIWGLDMANKMINNFDYKLYSKKRLDRYHDSIKKRTE
jgi:thiamine kinase-like enzyme